VHAFAPARASGTGPRVVLPDHADAAPATKLAACGEPRADVVRALLAITHGVRCVIASGAFCEGTSPGHIPALGRPSVRVWVSTVMSRDAAGGVVPRDGTLVIPERRILVYYEGDDPLRLRILLTRIIGACFGLPTPPDAHEESFSEAEERVGAERDPRLPPLAAYPVRNMVAFFRVALTHQKSPSASWPRFGGPPAAAEVCSSDCASGVEPVSWRSQWKFVSDCLDKSGLCLERRPLVYTLGTSVCVDGMDPGQVATVECLCRRILQVEKAAQRTANAPDLEGLGPYIRHVQHPSPGADSRVLDVRVADVLKVESAWLNQTRLSQEERVATEERRKDKKDGNSKKDGEGYVS
jgi:hypothetical protein